MASLPTNTKDIIWVPVAGALAVVILIIAVVFLNMKIQSVRRQIDISKETISLSLGNLARESALKAELERRAHDLDRIRAFVLKKESVGDYISALEAEASRLGLDLSIPAIDEERVVDENGEVIEQSGVLKKVRMKANVSGGTVEMLNFLNAVEYQPYLSGVVGWTLVTGDGAVTTGSRLSSLRAGVLNMPPADRNNNVLPSKPQGRMEMNILLSIFNDDNKAKEKK